MSQQEQVPGPQSTDVRMANSDQNYYGQRIYTRSKRSKTGDMLKDEHPSTFEDEVPPYVYRAQDNARVAHSSQQNAQAPVRRTTRDQQRARQRYSSDGDALENGYHPSKQYTVRRQKANQFQPWARPQNGGSRVLRWIILALLVVAVIYSLPVLFLVVLIPILIILGIALAGVLMLFVLLSAMGIPIFSWLRSRFFR